MRGLITSHILEIARQLDESVICLIVFNVLMIYQLEMSQVDQDVFLVDHDWTQQRSRDLMLEGNGMCLIEISWIGCYFPSAVAWFCHWDECHSITNEHTWKIFEMQSIWSDDEIYFRTISTRVSVKMGEVMQEILFERIMKSSSFCHHSSRTASSIILRWINKIAINTLPAVEIVAM
jgi:hypothetical protein